MTDRNFSSTVIFNTSPSTVVFVTCSEPGTYAFTVTRNNDLTTMDTFHILIESLPLMWFFTVIDTSTNSITRTLNTESENYLLRAWIYDPAYQNITEEQVAPTQTSRQLTSTFRSLGEYPTFSYDSREIEISVPVYSENFYWESTIHTKTIPGLLTFQIIGQNVSSWGRRLKHRKDVIAISKFRNLDFAQSQDNVLANSSYFRLIMDPFSVGHFYSLSSAFGAESVVIGDIINQGLKYHLKHSLSNGNALHSVAATKNGFVLATSTTLTFTINQTTSESIGIPQGMIDRVKSADYYDRSMNGTSVLNSLVFAWNSLERSVNGYPFIRLYYSKDSGRSFSLLMVNVNRNEQSEGSGYIMDLSIQHCHSNVAILIWDVSGSESILLFDPITETFENGYYSQTAILNHNKGSTPGLTSAEGNTLYLWGDNLHFSSDGGKTVSPISITSRDAQTVGSVGLTTTEFIKNFVTAKGGSFAFLTSTNRLFYGKAGVRDSIELNNGLSATSSRFF
jgi:hypothetical protein